MSTDLFAPPLPARTNSGKHTCAVYTIILDPQGLILAISSPSTLDSVSSVSNEETDEETDDETLEETAVSVGANYLELCRSSYPASTSAQEVVQGIIRVLEGSLACYLYTYMLPVQSTSQPFLMQVQPLAQAAGAALSHLDLQRLHSHYPVSDPNSYLQSALEEAQAQAAQLQILNHELEARASTDGLTGLKNYRAFQEQLQSEFERAHRYALPLSLVLLDIDHFKNHNDQFGHPSGDRVLFRLADLLRTGAREADFHARYGGEEFAVILPNTDAAGAYALVQRLHEAVIGADWPERPITASFGIASLTPSLESASALLVAADQALYAAKQAGRNCIRRAHDNI